MNNHLPNRWHLVAAVCLIVIGMWLTGCAPQEAIAKSPIPTPIGAAAMPSSPLPTPTRADGKPARQPPAPNSKVRVGEIAEVTIPVTPFSYSVHSEPNQNRIATLFVRNAQTGIETRLGNDEGDALLGASSDQYIIWEYQYYGQDKNPALPTGLYAYETETGKQIKIANGVGLQAYSEIDGLWMIYMDIQKSQQYFADLRAHNLATGEDFLVASNVAYRGPHNDYTAIGGNKIVWAEAKRSDASAKWMIRVYDLATRAMRTLNVPNIESPSLLSISGDIVVWWDEFWVGYDLKQDALFSIPTVPPEWQNLQQSPTAAITVKDGRLYWDITVNNQVHHFTAQVIRDK